MFLRDTDARPTLYLRKARRLTNPDPRRVRVVEGDVLDSARLEPAMKGQDVVYANLAGDMQRRAEHIVAAMHLFDGARERCWEALWSNSGARVQHQQLAERVNRADAEHSDTRVPYHAIGGEDHRHRNQ